MGLTLRIVALGVIFGTAIRARAEDPPAIAPPDRTKAPVVMEAMKIEGNYIPKLSFGLSLDVWRNNETQKVLAIYVRAVRPGSSAARQGLSARARIYAIDGEPVESFPASFVEGTPLNDKLVKRLDGARVVLEVARAGEAHAVTVTLEEKGVRIPGAMDLSDRYGN